MIDLYYWPTPNGHKITLFLEEAGLPYTVKPVDIGKGDQFRPEFLAFSPNNKIPAIIDHAPADGGAPLSVFESGIAEVFDSSGERPRYDDEQQARMALLDAEFRAFDGLDEEDAALMGFDLDSVAPPQGDDEDELLAQMMQKLARIQ